jgi:hypothetical protein
MLPSGKGYAVDISSLKRICSGHILFEEDMLSQSSLKRICSPVARDMLFGKGYAGHILFEEDMLRTYPL